MTGKTRITYRAARRKRGYLAKWWKLEHGAREWYAIRSPRTRAVRAGMAPVLAFGRDVRTAQRPIGAAELRRLASLPLAARTAAVESIVTRGRGGR